MYKTPEVLHGMSLCYLLGGIQYKSLIKIFAKILFSE